MGGALQAETELRVGQKQLRLHANLMLRNLSCFQSLDTAMEKVSSPLVALQDLNWDNRTFPRPVHLDPVDRHSGLGQLLCSVNVVVPVQARQTCSHKHAQPAVSRIG